MAYATIRPRLTRMLRAASRQFRHFFAPSSDDVAIVLEDGTLWDWNADPDAEPVRLRLCQNCASMMTSADKVRALLASEIEHRCVLRKCALRAVVTAQSYGHLVPKHEPLRYKGFLHESPQSEFDIHYLTLHVGKHRWKDCVVHTLPGDPAATAISRRPTLSDFNVMTVCPPITEWLTECQRVHRECDKHEISDLPTRLLEVVHAEDGLIRLSETRDHKDNYAILSYCWGGAQHTTLRESTLNTMMDVGGIPLSSLPKTIVDAILVTKTIGLRYIWVDALCIVQDSPLDMAEELGRMPQYYKNAYITLSADSAQSAREGFLQNHEHHRTPSKYGRPIRIALDFSVSEGAMGSIVVENDVQYDLSKEPISLRAWTLQERLLSRRTVHFGTQGLLWECQSRKAVAGFGNLMRQHGWDFPSLSDTLLNQVSADNLSQEAREKLHDLWESVVYGYSGRQLSMEADKLVALSALASEFQRVNKDEYLAGLWRQSLPTSLNWRVCGSAYDPRPRPMAYRAPSWSWPSTNYEVLINTKCWFGNAQKHLRMIRHEITLKDAALPTGEVTGGSLAILGRLRKCQVRRTGILGALELDTSDVVQGDISWDADEFHPSTVFLLRSGDCQGILLTRDDDRLMYRRLGSFESRAPCELDTVFAGRVLKIINIK